MTFYFWVRWGESRQGFSGWQRIRSSTMKQILSMRAMRTKTWVCVSFLRLGSACTCLGVLKETERKTTNLGGCLNLDHGMLHQFEPCFGSKKWCLVFLCGVRLKTNQQGVKKGYPASETAEPPNWHVCGLFPALPFIQTILRSGILWWLAEIRARLSKEVVKTP